jgi:hypothetical protein
MIAQVLIEALELHAYKAPSPFSALGLHPVDMVTLQVGRSLRAAQCNRVGTMVLAAV